MSKNSGKNNGKGKEMNKNNKKENDMSNISYGQDDLMISTVTRINELVNGDLDDDWRRRELKKHFHCVNEFAKKLLDGDLNKLYRKINDIASGCVYLSAHYSAMMYDLFGVENLSARKKLYSIISSNYEKIISMLDEEMRPLLDELCKGLNQHNIPVDTLAFGYSAYAYRIRGSSPQCRDYVMVDIHKSFNWDEYDYYSIGEYHILAKFPELGAKFPKLKLSKSSTVNKLLYGELNEQFMKINSLAFYRVMLHRHYFDMIKQRYFNEEICKIIKSYSKSVAKVLDKLTDPLLEEMRQGFNQHNIPVEEIDISYDHMTGGFLIEGWDKQHIPVLEIYTPM